jgi:hypothetical protein
MSEKPVRPIYFYPEDADLTIVQQAFSELNAPFKARPFPWQPGQPGPIIFVPKKESDNFPYVLDHAKITNKENAILALRWAFGLQSFEKGPKLLGDNLKRIFGEGTREVENDS